MGFRVTGRDRAALRRTLGVAMWRDPSPLSSEPPLGALDAAPRHPSGVESAAAGGGRAGRRPHDPRALVMDWPTPRWERVQDHSHFGPILGVGRGSRWIPLWPGVSDPPRRHERRPGRSTPPRPHQRPPGRARRDVGVRYRLHGHDGRCSRGCGPTRRFGRSWPTRAGSDLSPRPSRRLLRRHGGLRPVSSASRPSSSRPTGRRSPPI